MSEQTPPEDVRATRPVFLQRGWQRAVARRAASVAILVALDVAGLALGLYLALVLRELVFNGTDVLWGLIWEGPRSWLPFLAPVTCSSSGRPGSTRPATAAPARARSSRSLVLVALIVLAFGIGTDYEFTTTGLDPDRDGDLRAHDRPDASGLRVVHARSCCGRSACAGASSSSARVRALARLVRSSARSGPGSATTSSASSRPLRVRPDAARDAGRAGRCCAGPVPTS